MKSLVSKLFSHGFLLLLFLSLSLFFLSLTVLENQRAQQYWEFEAERSGEEMMRSLRDGFLSETASVLPTGTQGFGLYSPGGYPISALGAVPSTLDPQVFTGDRPRYWIETPTAAFFIKPLIPPGHGTPMGYMLVHLNPSERNLRRTVLWALYALGQAALAGVSFGVWRLQNKNRELRETLRLKEEANFLGDVGAVLAHEIKNPLATILLQARLLEPQAPEEAGIIAAEARRISSLVERVRDLVRDPVGQPETIDLISFLADQTHGPLTTTGEKAVIRMDRLRLRSVLDNLMDNARESQDGTMPPPQLRITKAQSRVALEILDQGKGLSPEVLRRLYTPFHTTKSQGTGLGLALVKRFMDGAGGTVTLENRPEGGVCARLEWPEEP